MTRRGFAVLVAYVAAIVAANLLTSWFGQSRLPGMALQVTWGTYAAGGALLLRDFVQDRCGARWVWVGIGVGAVLTALTSPSLALASTAAFVLAEGLDMAVYTPLREHGWARAALASGCVGALVDTLVFLSIAPFPFSWSSVGGQLVGKVVWATALPVAALIAVRQVRRGPVLRDSLNA